MSEIQSIVAEIKQFPSMENLTTQNKSQLNFYQLIDNGEDFYKKKLRLLSTYFYSYLIEQFKGWDALIIIGFEKIIKCRGDITIFKNTLMEISEITDGYVCFIDPNLFLVK